MNAKPHSLVIVAAFLLLSLQVPLAQAQVEEHPRLFVDEARLSKLRRAVHWEGTSQAEMYRALKERVDQDDWRVYDSSPQDDNWNYARSWLAREAALLYLLTEEDRYAETAFKALRAMHQDMDPDERIPEKGYGLSRAMTGMGFAVAYDWAYEGWTPAQRAYVRRKITAALDAFPSYEHPNLTTPHKGSNWVGVTRGGELVMMLAAYEEDDRSRRYRNLKEWLNQHMETAYGPTGWSQEGLGYVQYTSQFLLPAVFALRSTGDTDLDAASDRIDWHRWEMAAGSFTRAQYHLMSGVDTGNASAGQGWTSLLLNTVPAEERPYYAYYYDRHAGKRHPLPPARKYDPTRAGTTWALLYYPLDPQPRDPDGHLSRTLFDEEKGAYYFRSRWEDADDILLSIMGDYEHHGNAWDVHEAFQLGLIAHGTRFVEGPGKTGTGSDARHDGFSTLLVDERAFPESGRIGAPMFSSREEDGSGYVVVGGGEKYAGLGLRGAERHLLVDFSNEGGEALLSTLDRVQAADRHTYTWQLNPGEDVRIDAGHEDGRKTFTLRGEGESYVKGWVLHPVGAALSAGDPLRVSATGTNQRIWIAMAVGAGTPPIGTVAGRGLDAVLQVGSQRVQYDAQKERIQLSSD